MVRVYFLSTPSYWYHASSVDNNQDNVDCDDHVNMSSIDRNQFIMLSSVNSNNQHGVIFSIRGV